MSDLPPRIGITAPSDFITTRLGLQRARREAGPRTCLTRTIVFVALCWCAWAGVVAAQTVMQKPRVPPGVDPGGVAFAIIGSGIDYTRPQIAHRLARDGEGQIFGWDFVDNDRLPYDICTRAAADVRACTTDIAAGMLSSAPTARLIAIRAAPSRPQSLVQAMLLVSQSPARLVLIDIVEEPKLVTHFLEDAAARFPDILLIVDRNRLERANPKSSGPANLIASDDPASSAATAARLREQNPATTIPELAAALAKP